jgi:TP901 family phage tail tape measure protein
MAKNPISFDSLVDPSFRNDLIKVFEDVEKEAVKNIAAIKAEFKTLGKSLKESDPSTEGGQKEIVELTNKIKLLEAELTKLKKARDDSKKGLTELEKAEAKLAKVRGKDALEIEKLNVKTQEQRKINKALARDQLGLTSVYSKQSAKLNDLRKKYKDLALTEGTATRAARKLKREITSLDSRLKKVDASVGQFQRNVGNYRAGLRSLGGILSAAGLTLGAAGFFQIVRNGLKVLKDYDEGLANLRKTTNTTREEAEILASQINLIDTRTSVKELLELATAGGRLGLTGIELVNFTKSVNLAFIALGDTLEGSAQDIGLTLGKIASQFGDEAKFGIGGAISRVGSSLNELGANSKATEDKIIDFTKRLAGVAAQAGISSPDILALGALFDSTGQSIEVSATTLNKLLPALGKETVKFAKIAGVGIKEFEKLLRKDAFEALKLVAKGAQSNDKGLIGLSKTLKNYGIESARAASIVGILSGNVDELTRLQEISNRAFEENTSLAKEAAIKNETLSATYEKLENRWDKFVISLEQGQGVISRVVKRYIGAFAELLDIITRLNDTDASIIERNAQAIVNSTKVTKDNVDAIDNLIDRYDKQAKAKRESIKLTQFQIREEEKRRKAGGERDDTLDELNKLAIAYDKDARLSERVVELLKLKQENLNKNKKAIDDNSSALDENTSSANRNIGAYRELTKEINNLNSSLLDQLTLTGVGEKLAASIGKLTDKKDAIDATAKALVEFNRALDELDKSQQTRKEVLKLISDETLSYVRRRDILRSTQSIVENAYESEIQLFELENRVSINRTKLIELSNKEAFEYLTTLGITNVESIKIIKTIEKRKKALEDVTKANKKLNTQQEQNTRELNAQLLALDKELNEDSLNQQLIFADQSFEITKRELEEKFGEQEEFNKLIEAEETKHQEELNDIRLGFFEKGQEKQLKELELSLLKSGKTETEIAKELQQAKIDLLIEEIAKRKELGKQTLDQELELARLQMQIAKDAAQERKDLINDVIELSLDTIQKRLDKEQEALDKEVEKQDEATTKQEQRAEQGLSNTLAFEEQQGAELEKQQLEAAERQKKLDKVKAIYAAYQNYSSQGEDNAVGKTLRDIAILEGVEATFAESGGVVSDIKTTIPVLKEGRILSGQRHSRGGVLVNAEGEEGIFARSEMQNLGKDNFYKLKEHLKHNTLSTNFFEDQNNMSIIPVPTHTNERLLLGKLKDIESTIKNKAETNIDVDGLRGAIVETRRERNVKSKIIYPYKKRI